MSWISDCFKKAIRKVVLKSCDSEIKDLIRPMIVKHVEAAEKRERFERKKIERKVDFIGELIKYFEEIMVCPRCEGKGQIYPPGMYEDFSRLIS